jgi:hypothetical protein
MDMYNPNEFVEKKVLKPGTTITAKVTDIKKGVLSDFMAAEVLAKWENTTPDAACIEVTATTADGFSRKKILPLPLTNEIHPKSNLAKWKKLFGAYPEEHQEIYLIADGEGYYQFP